MDIVERLIEAAQLAVEGKRDEQPFVQLSMEAAAEIARLREKIAAAKIVLDSIANA